MFVDANIFIKWLVSRRMLDIEEVLSGYILYRISNGENAVTSSIVKDEVLIWLSRYRASGLKKFMQAIKLMPTLEIVEPTLEDQEEAIKMYGKYPLGFSDLINLSLIKRLNLDGIYTNDKGFLSTGVKVVFENLKNEREFKNFVELLKEKGYILRSW